MSKAFNEAEKIRRRIAWVESDAYKDGIEARRKTRDVLANVASAFNAPEFVELLRYVGVKSAPVVQSNSMAQHDERCIDFSEFGRNALSLLVARAFLTSLGQIPIAAAYLDANLSELIRDVESAVATIRKHGFFHNAE